MYCNYPIYEIQISSTYPIIQRLIIIFATNWDLVE